VQHAKDARRVILIEVGGEASPNPPSRRVDDQDVNGLWREGSSLTKTAENPRKDTGKEKEKEEWLSLLVREHLGASPLLSIPLPFIPLLPLPWSDLNLIHNILAVDLKYILRNQRLQVTFEGRTRVFCVSKLYASGDQDDDGGGGSGDLSAALENMTLHSDVGKKESAGAAMQLWMMNWDMNVEFQKSKVRFLISLSSMLCPYNQATLDNPKLSQTIHRPVDVQYGSSHLPPSSNASKRRWRRRRAVRVCRRSLEADW
jgi:hypothetical protein